MAEPSMPCIAHSQAPKGRLRLPKLCAQVEVQLEGAAWGHQALSQLLHKKVRACAASGGEARMRLTKACCLLAYLQLASVHRAYDDPRP